MPNFTLRFPGSQISQIATRYAYPGEAGLMDTLAPTVRSRRQLTLGDLKRVCEWKSSRIGRKIDANSESDVAELSAFALRAESERARIGSLRLLHGVDWPTASVILHFFHADPYPILDRRAVWSLQSLKPSLYTFDFWMGYVRACRSLASQHGVTMRALDRALWQYSKENQSRIE